MRMQKCFNNEKMFNYFIKSLPLILWIIIMFIGIILGLSDPSGNPPPPTTGG